jgi:hypothetical protein
MKNQFKIFIVIFLFLIVMGFILLWGIVSKGRINNESYEKIKFGMTRLEVEQILGGPPEKIKPNLIGLGGTLGSTDIMENGEVWTGNKFKLFVRFDKNGEVSGLLREFTLQESLLDKFVRWLHLSW